MHPGLLRQARFQQTVMATSGGTANRSTNRSADRATDRATDGSANGSTNGSTDHGDVREIILHVDFLKYQVEFGSKLTLRIAPEKAQYVAQCFNELLAIFGILIQLEKFFFLFSSFEFNKVVKAMRRCMQACMISMLAMPHKVT